MRSLRRCWQVLAVFFVAFVLKEEGISSTTTKKYMKLENKKSSQLSLHPSAGAASATCDPGAVEGRCRRCSTEQYVCMYL